MPSDAQNTAMRERLRELIAAQDKERGRPLTNQERLANLAAFMAEDDGPCPYCSVRDDEPCGAEADDRRCELEKDCTP